MGNKGKNCVLWFLTAVNNLYLRQLFGLDIFFVVFYCELRATEVDKMGNDHLFNAILHRPPSLKGDDRIWIVRNHLIIIEFQGFLLLR